MKEIELTQGQVALVDDGDYEWLSQWKWYADKRLNGDFDAVRQLPREKRKRHKILMHRQILGLEYGDKRESDHRNHNSLDNCRSNIRVCTTWQNQHNRKPQQRATSEFKGVHWHKLHKKWGVNIRLTGKVKYLGSFELEELAALAYDMVAIREHGEFAYLNFN